MRAFGCRKGEIDRVKNENLFRRMGYIVEESARLDKEFPSGPDEPTHPRIKELLREAEEIQKELDPLMRGTFRDNPKMLAEWDEIMHMCDDLEPETENKSES
jgi:hypothetical protein